MVIPAELVVYGNSQVFTIGLGFEDVAMKEIIVDLGGLASGNSEHTALLGVKFHLPFLLPYC